MSKAIRTVFPASWWLDLDVINLFHLVMIIQMSGLGAWRLKPAFGKLCVSKLMIFSVAFFFFFFLLLLFFLFISFCRSMPREDKKLLTLFVSSNYLLLQTLRMGRRTYVVVNYKICAVSVSLQVCQIRLRCSFYLQGSVSHWLEAPASHQLLCFPKKSCVFSCVFSLAWALQQALCCSSHSLQLSSSSPPPSSLTALSSSSSTTT